MPGCNHLMISTTARPEVLCSSSIMAKSTCAPCMQPMHGLLQAALWGMQALIHSRGL